MKLYFILFSILLSACVKEVPFEVDLPSEKLIINSTFAPHEHWRVFITQSIAPTDTLNFESVRNAEVTIKEEDGRQYKLTEFVLPEKTGSFGFYTNSEILIKENRNKKFEIEVIKDGIESVTSESLIPILPPYEVEFQVTKYEKDFELNDRIFYTLQGELSLIFDSSSPPPLYVAIRLFYLTDDIRSNRDDENSSEDSTIYKQLSLNLDASFLDPFFLRTSILKQIDIERQFNSIKGYVDQNIVFQKEDFFNKKVYVEVISLSEDYFQYIDSYSKQRSALADPFAEPASVYNNINGGYGIFAGFNMNRDTIEAM